MPGLNQLSRYGRIVKRLSGSQEYVSSEELLASMRGAMPDGRTYTVRTLQRDMNAISGIFGIEIKNKRGAGYHIVNRSSSTQQFTDSLADCEILFNRTSQHR